MAKRDDRDIWERAIDEPFTPQDPDVERADDAVKQAEREFRDAKKRAHDLSGKRKTQNEHSAQAFDFMRGYPAGAALFLGQRGIRRLFRRAPLRTDGPGIILRTNAAGFAGGVGGAMYGASARQTERKRRRKK